MAIKKQFKKKRWTVAGHVKTPFGGGGLRLSSRGFAKAVDKIVRRDLEEPMHKTISESTQAMTHSTIYTLNILGNITRGTAYNNRIGDSIHLEAIKIRGLHVSPAVSNPVTIRLLLVKNRQQFAGGSDAWTSGLGSTDLYFDSPAQTPYGICDPKTVTVLEDHTFKVVPQVATTVNYHNINIFHKFNSNFIYETGTNFAKNMNYYLVAMGYVSGGSTGVTSVGTMLLNADIVFKNR